MTEKKYMIPGSNWCVLHQCTAEDCWSIHNPGAHAGERDTRAETEEELKERVAHQHVAVQEINRMFEPPRTEPNGAK